MPRLLLKISFITLLIYLIIPFNQVRADSQLVFVSGEEYSVSLVDNSAVLNIPKQALSGPSRVSLANRPDIADIPAQSFGAVYSWQILDAEVLQPLSFKINYSLSSDTGIQVWQRLDQSQPWELVDFQLDNNQVEVAIKAKFGQLVLSELNLTPFTITLDKATVTKGYHVKTPDNYFGFHILPEVFTDSVTIEVNPLSPSIYQSPANLKLVSPIYHFKINSEEDFLLTKDLPVEIRFWPGQANNKEIYYWNNLDNKWEVSPSLTRYQAGVVRTLTRQAEVILAVMSGAVMEKGLASWYKYKQGDFAASPDYPKDTKLKVTEVNSGKSVIVSVNDYGPDRSIHPDRVIDLDYVAFRKIASPNLGLITVSVEQIFY